MKVESSLPVLRVLKKIPPILSILPHRDDKEKFNKEKQIRLHEINRIKNNYNIMLSIVGRYTIQEAWRSIFNDADIFVI